MDNSFCMHGLDLPIDIYIKLCSCDQDLGFAPLHKSDDSIAKPFSAASSKWSGVNQHEINKKFVG